MGLRVSDQPRDGAVRTARAREPADADPIGPAVEVAGLGLWLAHSCCAGSLRPSYSRSGMTMYSTCLGRPVDAGLRAGQALWGCRCGASVVSYERVGGLTKLIGRRSAGMPRLGDRVSKLSRGRPLPRQCAATGPEARGAVLAGQLLGRRPAAQFAVSFDGNDPLLAVPRQAASDRHFSCGSGSGRAGRSCRGSAGAVGRFLRIFERSTRPLLYLTLGVVMVLLLLTSAPLCSGWCRSSPRSAGLTVAEEAAYLLAKHGGLTVNGLSQGIMLVLTIGAGVDYALLLVSRYRRGADAVSG